LSLFILSFSVCRRMVPPLGVLLSPHYVQTKTHPLPPPSYCASGFCRADFTFLLFVGVFFRFCTLRFYFFNARSPPPHPGETLPTIMVSFTLSFFVLVHGLSGYWGEGELVWTYMPLNPSLFPTPVFCRSVPAAPSLLRSP